MEEKARHPKSYKRNKRERRGRIFTALNDHQNYHGMGRFQLLIEFRFEEGKDSSHVNHLLQ